MRFCLTGQLRVNFELNDETLNMHRDWLLGSGEPPVRKIIDPLHRINARLISVEIPLTGPVPKLAS